MAPATGSVRKRQGRGTTLMDEWVAEFIRRTILKISLSEALTTLKAWGFLSEGELQTLNLRPKELLAMEVVQLCEGKNATMKDAANLDFVFNHANSEKKSWSVYQMSKTSDSEIDFFDLSEYKLQFRKAIHSVSKNVTIHFKEFGEAVWIRIAWGKNHIQPNQYKPTFVVYHSQTPYVFVTNLGKSFRPLLCQALVVAASYSQIQELELKSRSLESLKDIVFKRFHQPFQSYHPRPLQEGNYNPAIVDPRVTYENMREKERIHHITRETFGDGQLPKLEFASYKLETTFKSTGAVPPRPEPYRCVVKFSSPHLLESIRSLARAGISDAPVSNLLTCIPQKARNIFKITEKQRALHPTPSQQPPL
ncbi:centromere protein N [Spea bombifrons]|uniref:centromere protein N n=1 Tax=Spea bombifrons TaxID=233779 RepID=UPI00234B7AE2|nr:centromere protein N [Spea bombifrons]